MISCTYQSADAILDAERLIGKKIIDLQINDEAQYLVSTEFQQYHAVGKRVVSFTATERVTEEDENGVCSGLGMNNEERFGPRLFWRTPRQMVDAGEMVPPAVHVVDVLDATDDDLGNDYACLAKCIESAYHEHDSVVQERSGGELSGKMMVICEGCRSLAGIMGVIDKMPLLKAGGVKIFALCSNYGIYFDGERHPSTNTRKEDFLVALKNLKDSDRAIILQVDMLSEGIDVPGITGIMPFRNLGPNKFIQNLGRAARLNSTDRMKLYSGELLPTERSKFLKPYAWVIIPRLLKFSADAANRYRWLVRQMKTEYELGPGEFVILDSGGSWRAEEDNGERPEPRGVNSGAEQFRHILEDDILDCVDLGEQTHDVIALIDLLNTLEPV